ncbi:MAG: hypothetical protein V9E83_09520 [Baekduia sp.]
MLTVVVVVPAVAALALWRLGMLALDSDGSIFPHLVVAALVIAAAYVFAWHFRPRGRSGWLIAALLFPGTLAVDTAFNFWDRLLD